jgi:tRNA(Ile)-lysidine synthase
MIKYIAAVSGGPDSMAMLDIYKKNVALVCHVNYQKRDSAYRDAGIVKMYCKNNHIKFNELIVTENIYRKYRKINNNFQAIARLIRYDFFLKCAKQMRLNHLLVAHNKDDFLETALMQLGRKSKTLFYGISNTTNY